MTANDVYWIADPEGVKAYVTTPGARDFWTKVRGWTETTEPTGHEFQWVRNENHGGRGVLNHEAALLHEGLGWHPCGPSPVEGMPEESESGPAAAPPAAPVNTAIGGTGKDLS